MKRVQLPLAALAVAVLTFTACGGDDGGDDPDTTDATEETTGSDDTTASDDTAGGDESGSGVPEEMRELYPNLTDEDLECLNDVGEDIDTEDMGAITDALEECGVDMADLVPSDVTMPEGMPDMNEVMSNLTPDQLECMGTEGANLDPTDMDAALEVLETCGIDPSVLTGG